MNLLKLRAALSIIALLSIVAFAAGVLFFGKELTPVQITLLTLLAAALIAECKSASAFIFDGTPDKTTDSTNPPQP